MTLTRPTLILTLTLALAAGVFAQETSTAATSTAAKATTSTTDTTEQAATTAQEEPTSAEPAALGPSSYEVRARFTQVLNRYPYELTQVLKLDPSLLTNESYMNGYRELSEFVQKHPEVLRNPRFYLAEFAYPGQSNTTVIDRVVEMILVFCGFALGAFAISWLIRTVIEQRRWNRLSRVQTDVHTKILDRFGTSQEVLDYIKSPAGSKFLESAPIPLHAPKPAPVGPQSRILWSIQLGIVIAIGALGMMLVSARFDGESGQSLFAMGGIGFCVGLGFVVSALVSLGLSRRLGMWEERGDGPLDESGVVR